MGKLDQDALLAKVVENIGPALEQMLSSDAFQEKLATVIGAQYVGAMSGDGDDEEAAMDADRTIVDQDGEDDPSLGMAETSEDDDMMMDVGAHSKGDDAIAKDACSAKDKMSDTIKDSIRKKTVNTLKALDAARCVNPDVKVNYKSPLGTLRRALKPYMGDEAAKKPLGYLMGYADNIMKKRASASVQINDIQSGTPTVNRGAEDTIMQALESAPAPASALDIRKMVLNAKKRG